MLARLDDSVLIVVDLQPNFLRPIHESDRILERARFLVRCAKVLGVPILVSEQVPDRMGGTDPGILEHVPSSMVISKSAFSCLGSESFVDALQAVEKSQAVLVGIETHICVNQTAHDLMDAELDVLVCADAVSARLPAMHEAALNRMRDEGAALAHTESVVYEWMQDSQHASFRDILDIVKVSHH